MTDTQKPVLELLIAAPRGFCAGVDRAIQIVERAIELHGAPVYVRHEIVHNKYVVDTLKAKGAIFVDELDQVPDGVHVVFSAHGVPKSVPAAAQNRGLSYFDATCPLVSKVHRQAERLVAAGRHILFIGHEGHPEVIGTFGQVPDGAMTLIETEADAESVAPAEPGNLAFLTQTTLSVDDTASILAILQRRFPDIVAPKADDICYATQNRQVGVKEIAPDSDVVIVVGSGNSSNSVRLVEVALEAGAGSAYRVDSAQEIDPAWFDGATTVGVTSGASVPDVLVNDVLDSLKELGFGTVEEVTTAEETLVFALPPELRRDLKAASAEASANASS